MALMETHTTLSQILPQTPSFSGHGTFAIRSGWLKKSLDLLAVNTLDGSIFNRPDALVILGVGKNMVGAIRYWLLATRMACEKGKGRELVVEKLGQCIFADNGWDPFLEDEATLWLLHWQLAGPQTCSFTWAYAFNCFRDWEFTRDQLVDAILAATHSFAKPPSRETVDRDIGCFLQTYVSAERSGLGEDNLDCPLRALSLIRSSQRGHYRFMIESKAGLAPAIFFYALTKFWIWKYPDARTLSAWEICHAEGSPGLVFKLDENSVLEYLDELEETSNGILRFEDTVQTRQVVLRDNVKNFDPHSFLENYYTR